MNEIEFTVYSVPVAQPRQRNRIFKSKAGKLIVGNYTPGDDPVNAYKYHLKTTAKEVMNRAPLFEGPLGMKLEVFLPRPKRLDGKKGPFCATWHYGKKDVDNLFKSVADALIGVVYRDDGQICNATIQKFYHERDGWPRVHVKIWGME